MFSAVTYFSPLYSLICKDQSWTSQQCQLTYVWNEVHPIERITPSTSSSDDVNESHMQSNDPFRDAILPRMGMSAICILLASICYVSALLILICGKWKCTEVRVPSTDDETLLSIQKSFQCTSTTKFFSLLLISLLISVLELLAFVLPLYTLQSSFSPGTLNTIIEADGSSWEERLGSLIWREGRIALLFALILSIIHTIVIVMYWRLQWYANNYEMYILRETHQISPMLCGNLHE